MTAGRVNASARKIASGYSALISRDQPLPEVERLGVRVVDAEDPDALLGPEQDHARQLLPQRLPGIGLEVERVDVLVLLGRVLRVLDRAVRTHAGTTPDARVDVRVVGRALERDVERELDPSRLGGGDQLARSRRACRAPGGSPCGRPRRTRSPTGCPDRRASQSRALLGPLRLTSADRVDRRQVEHVEAHGLDVGESRLNVPKRAVAAPHRRAGAGEQLVPGAEPRLLAVHGHGQLRLVDGREGPLAVARHQVGQLRIQGTGGPRRPAGAQRLRRRPQRPRISRRPGPGGPLGRRLDQPDPDQQLHRHVLPCVEALAQVARPGVEPVDPGLDRVPVAADGVHAELGPEPVVAQRLHRHLGPRFLVVVPVEQHRADQVVPVGDDLGLDHHRIADDALDREPSAVDLRRQLRDRDPAPAVQAAHDGAASFPAALTPSEQRPVQVQRLPGDGRPAEMLHGAPAAGRVPSAPAAPRPAPPG